MKGRYVFASVLVVIGLGLLLDQFYLLNFGYLISTWWPVILIAFGLIMITNTRSSIFSGSLMILIGLLLQANKLDMLPWGFWGTFWPIMLIVVGLWILFSRWEFGKRKIQSDDFISMDIMFTGVKQRLDSQNFKGGNISTIFGGADIDLRNCQILNSSAQMEISSAFGGITLKVPNNWNIDMRGFPFFGGVDNKTHQTINSDSPTLKIKYNVAFGGIEIKN